MNTLTAVPKSEKSGASYKARIILGVILAIAAGVILFFRDQIGAGNSPTLWTVFQVLSVIIAVVLFVTLRDRFTWWSVVATLCAMGPLAPFKQTLFLIVASVVVAGILSGRPKFGDPISEATEALQDLWERMRVEEWYTDNALNSAAETMAVAQNFYQKFNSANQQLQQAGTKANQDGSENARLGRELEAMTRDRNRLNGLLQTANQRIEELQAVPMQMLEEAKKRVAALAPAEVPPPPAPPAPAVDAPPPAPAPAVPAEAPKGGLFGMFG